MNLHSWYKQLQGLEKEFICPTHPKICGALVQGTFAENKLDFWTTKQYLQKYHLFWSMIMQLHNQRNQTIKENYGQDKNLVRERNNSLDCLLSSRKLLFDLHGFTVKGALCQRYQISYGEQ
ncbi:hypothetical protein CRE_03373 [Caenorhabditis remanei]|uniref:Uncharacterized protein n=1 Tax=Caenorhabditis remanei TaxID=31234 RepID=E3N636_CAERE|nr:hypothetical protein CRE_03373 [Caenorhabditis remanei]